MISAKAKKEKFLKMLKECEGNVSSTCRLLGIPRPTFYAWMNHDEEFAKAVDDIYEELIDNVEEALRGRIAAGDTTAIIFFLKTRGKSRGYTEEKKININDVTDYKFKFDE